MMVRLWVPLLWVSLLSVSLVAAQAAWAQGVPDIAIDDDAEESSDPSASSGKIDWSQQTWPTESRFDTASRVATFTWPTPGGLLPEEVPFDDLIRFERARAYEGSPEELFISVADGRRVLISRGPDVMAHAALAPSLTRLPLKELAPGEGHFKVAVDAGLGPPRMIIGSGDKALAIRSAPARSVTGDAPREGAEAAASSAEPSFEGEGGGTLEKSDIDGTIKNRMAQYQGCYQRELQRDPSLAGKVVVAFVIDRDGTIKDAKIRASSLGNTVVEECLVGAVRATRFPPPKGVGTIVVTYPFLFSSGR